MNVLMLNASPKRITSASRYFLGLLGMMMPDVKTTRMDLSTRLYGEIFGRFKSIDALVIALPVYVDGVPSNALRFMAEAEKFCRENGCRFKLYVMTNCGFYEAKQCRHVLNNMRSFCEAAGLEWGGGLGVGTGEMLSVLRISPLFELARLILSLPFFILSGDFLGGLMGYPWINALINLLVYVVFSLGLFYSIWKMQRIIRRGKAAVSDFYTRVIILPRFLFSIGANGYFIIRSALFGTGFLRLYKKG